MKLELIKAKRNRNNKIKTKNSFLKIKIVNLTIKINRLIKTYSKNYKMIISKQRQRHPIRQREGNTKIKFKNKKKQKNIKMRSLKKKKVMFKKIQLIKLLKIAIIM